MIEHERVLQIKKKIQREQVKRDLECKECWVGMGKTGLMAFGQGKCLGAPYPKH